jgi:hypothetical protein
VSGYRDRTSSEVPPFQPWAAEAARKYADRPGDDPRAQCMPTGVTRRRIDRGRMSVEITIDDPGAYTRPWKVRRLLQLAEGEEVQEYLCNENHKTEHFVGGNH